MGIAVKKNSFDYKKYKVSFGYLYSNLFQHEQQKEMRDI